MARIRNRQMKKKIMIGAVTGTLFLSIAITGHRTYVPRASTNGTEIAQQQEEDRKEEDREPEEDKGSEAAEKKEEKEPEKEEKKEAKEKKDTESNAGQDEPSKESSGDNDGEGSQNDQGGQDKEDQGPSESDPGQQEGNQQDNSGDSSEEGTAGGETRDTSAKEEGTSEDKTKTEAEAGQETGEKTEDDEKEKQKAYMEPSTSTEAPAQAQEPVTDPLAAYKEEHAAGATEKKKKTNQEASKKVKSKIQKKVSDKEKKNNKKTKKKASTGKSSSGNSGKSTTSQTANRSSYSYTPYTPVNGGNPTLPDTQMTFERKAGYSKSSKTYIESSQKVIDENKEKIADIKDELIKKARICNAINEFYEYIDENLKPGMSRYDALTGIVRTNAMEHRENSVPGSDEKIEELAEETGFEELKAWASIYTVENTDSSITMKIADDKTAKKGIGELEPSETPQVETGTAESPEEATTESAQETTTENVTEAKREGPLNIAEGDTGEDASSEAPAEVSTEASIKEDRQEETKEATETEKEEESTEKKEEEKATGSSDAEGSEVQDARLASGQTSNIMEALDLMVKENENGMQENWDEIDELNDEIYCARRLMDSSKLERVFDPNDVTVVSNVTAEEAKEMLSGTYLEPLAKTFTECEKEYGVNAIFLMSIAAHESNWGRSRRAIQDHNYTGFGVYSNSAIGINADNGETNIKMTAAHLATNYLTPGAKYYHGKSVRAVHTMYCATGGWTNGVVTIGDKLIAKLIN